LTNGWKLLVNNNSNSRLFFLKAGGNLPNIRLHFKKDSRDVFYMALLQDFTKNKKHPSLCHVFL